MNLKCCLIRNVPFPFRANIKSLLLIFYNPAESIDETDLSTANDELIAFGKQSDASLLKDRNKYKKKSDRKSSPLKGQKRSQKGHGNMKGSIEELTGSEDSESLITRERGEQDEEGKRIIPYI